MVTRLLKSNMIKKPKPIKKGSYRKSYVGVPFIKLDPVKGIEMWMDNRGTGSYATTSPNII